MKVTLHEVAARAKLSIATVSRALNGLPVSKASAARVEKAVAELGYVPNEAARALRSERADTIGLIFSDLRNTLGIELLDALSEAVEEAGYSLIIATARGSAERYDHLMRNFLERRVDALFCVRPPAESAHLQRYEALDIPVIALFGASGAFAHVPRAGPVLTGAAKAAAAHLSALGHKRVTLVREGRSPVMVALAEALRAHAIEPAFVDQADSASSGDLLSDILGRQKATAVVVSDPQVRGLLAAARAQEISVPGELSVIAVTDAATDAYHLRHEITSLSIDPHRMGQAAAAAMLGWLGGVHPGPKIRVQTGALNVRATTGPVRRRKGG